MWCGLDPGCGLCAPGPWLRDPVYVGEWKPCGLVEMDILTAGTSEEMEGNKESKQLLSSR